MCCTADSTATFSLRIYCRHVATTWCMSACFETCLYPSRIFLESHQLLTRLSLLPTRLSTSAILSTRARFLSELAGRPDFQFCSLSMSVIGLLFLLQMQSTGRRIFQVISTPSFRQYPHHLCHQ